MLDDYTDEFVPEIGGISLREYENIVNEIENQPSWRAIAAKTGCRPYLFQASRLPSSSQSAVNNGR